jgi:hypothetical protein
MKRLIWRIQFLYEVFCLAWMQMRDAEPGQLHEVLFKHSEPEEEGYTLVDYAFYTDEVPE